jgi:hypothetical protein
MSDAKIIAATLTVDSDQAVKNVLKLKGTVADLKKELANAKAGSEEQVAAFKKLQTAEQDLAKANKQLSDSNKETAGHFSKLKEGISSLPGATGAAGKGVEGLNTKFKELLANPIGLVLTAIVVVLTALYKAFTNTFEGGEKVEQVFAGIKAAGQALLDNLTKIGSAIVKLMKFDFSGAIEDIKGVAKAAGDAYTAMAKLTKQAQELGREQADNDLDQAKRQAKLAELKAKAADGDISAADRKKAAKELLEESKKNAQEDLDLARRTAENKIAQLTLEKDGAKKNYIEIQKIKAEQIQGETQNSNELKQIAKQVTAAEKEEQAERKAAAQKAAEEEKKRRQELVEFTNKLTKLQQDNELALLKDSFDKELKALENRIADEKRQNQLAFQERKITKDQQAQLDAALDIQANLQRDAIEDKRKKDIAAKEIAFQKELSDITSKTRIAGIKDARQSELIQLEIGYQEKLKLAIEKYKDDAAKLAEIQTAIDEQYRTEKAAKEAKFKEEDDKKKLEKDITDQEKILTDTQSTLDQKKAALDAEQVIIQAAFDNKTLTEAEYLAKKKVHANHEMAIDELIAQNKIKTFDLISRGLGALSDLVGKNTAAGKIAAIAATTISTYEAAWSIFRNASKNPASIPFPAYPYIQAGLAIVAGLKTVNDIVKVKTPGGGSAGAAPTASAITAPAAPIAPTQSSTSIDQDSINNIGNAAAGGVNSVRAYVVEQDSAEAANRAARLKGAALLGG